MPRRDLRTPMFAAALSAALLAASAAAAPEGLE